MNIAHKGVIILTNHKMSFGEKADNIMLENFFGTKVNQQITYKK